MALMIRWSWLMSMFLDHVRQTQLKIKTQHFRRSLMKSTTLVSSGQFGGRRSKVMNALISHPPWVHWWGETGFILKTCLGHKWGTGNQSCWKHWQHQRPSVIQTRFKSPCHRELTIDNGMTETLDATAHIAHTIAMGNNINSIWTNNHVL